MDFFFSTGIPVDDAVLTVETDGTGQHVQDASGVVYQGIEDDTDGTTYIDSDTAETNCLDYNNHIHFIGNVHKLTVMRLYIQREKKNNKQTKRNIYCFRHSYDLKFA